MPSHSVDLTLQWKLKIPPAHGQEELIINSSYPWLPHGATFKGFVFLLSMFFQKKDLFIAVGFQQTYRDYFFSGCRDIFTDEIGPDRQLSVTAVDQYGS
jgi:hypothetical protein